MFSLLVSSSTVNIRNGGWPSGVQDSRKAKVSGHHPYRERENRSENRSLLSALFAVAQHDLHALLNPHSGFASRIYRKRLEDPQDASIPQEIELARLELNTWMLLQALMAAKITSEPQPTLYQNPYAPTSTLAQAILRVSPLLTKLIIVREWLHDTAAQPSIPEATTKYWSFTKHMLVQSQRMSTTPAAGIVDALDPDAMSKNGGHLASDDAVSVTMYIKDVF